MIPNLAKHQMPWKKNKNNKPISPYYKTVFVLEFGEFVVTNIKLYSGMYLKLLIHSLKL